MLGKIIKRWFSGFAAAVLTVSNIAPAVPTSAEDTPELCYQNIELYPNGEDAEQVVTLDGLMPEGAEAEAVDVSDEHEGIAAYDITITDGWRDYQPGEEHPIWVEITDPVITENIQLWHIHDDGEREQIFDFTAEEGKVSFYATGFSVYEIVDYTLAAPEGTGWLKVASVADLANYGEGSSGLYISTASEPGYFFMNQTVTSDAGNSSKERIGIKKTKNNGACFYNKNKEGIEMFVKGIKKEFYYDFDSRKINDE